MAAPNDAASSDLDLSKPHSADMSRSADLESAPSPAAAPTQTKVEQPAAPAPPTANDASSIPDGGLVAWLQVAGGFSLFFNTWGNLNTFGIFQTYYESGALFKETSSNIAWIGAVQAALLLALGMFSGPIYDRGYLRALLLVGSFMTVFGYMMTSLCTEFWQVVLAQGFCVGIGGGCLFIPAVAILPTYFRRRLGLAVGLAASGSSMGGVIYPIVFYRLIDRIGFGWTVRVIGFIALATLLIPCLVMKMRVKPPRVRAVIDTTVFTDVPFLIFVGALFLGFIALYVVLFYISYFGAATGVTDQKLSFYLIPILNAASVFGRTLPNAISDYVGTLNIIGPGALICAILTLCLIAVHSTGGLVAIAVFYGFFSGVFIALPPVCIAILTPDKTKIGTRLGMAFAFLSFAVLIGGPGAGALLGADPMDLHWNKTWAFGGALAAGGGLILSGLRMWKANWKIGVKI
ncbi:major facilitator superfamily transporter monocarboxylate [Myriangium duriaei CBS 260.36]|uniref:Major facilitator superfamily transporter monocarboxylate n=1 Tax=Myriangium duriaei CBS 260.36 TaxID=1168546 RepID=A0A9P4MCM7_9PEZI|nr:major facilitator superfamily transporter monocarboxylate [Myriangium duriaei CBS 260.36]